MKHIARNLAIALGTGALIVASTGVAGAQDATPKQNSAQTQAKKAAGSAQGQAQGSQQQSGAVRKLGPGDGTGNQGVRPQDGTGNGSPGRIGGENGKGKNMGANQKGTNGKSITTGKVSKSARRGSVSAGCGQGTLIRSRARDLSGSGAGGCTGSGTQSRRGGSRGSGNRRR